MANKDIVLRDQCYFLRTLLLSPSSTQNFTVYCSIPAVGGDVVFTVYCSIPAVGGDVVFTSLCRSAARRHPWSRSAHSGRPRSRSGSGSWASSASSCAHPGSWACGRRPGTACWRPWTEEGRKTAPVCYDGKTRQDISQEVIKNIL